MMRSDKPLLLPANPWFIWGSLVGALALNMFLPMAFTGRANWSPDWVALTLAFWVIHQPRRIGVGTAFVFGLLMDAHTGTLLGLHGLAYTVLAYLCTLIHRRLLWFKVSKQALHMWPLFLIANALQWLARDLAGHDWAGWGTLLAPTLEAALWPLATALLLAPQRRPYDVDENRPL
jgi:rod shape-determining protein MreD